MFRHSAFENQSQLINLLLGIKKPQLQGEKERPIKCILNCMHFSGQKFRLLNESLYEASQFLCSVSDSKSVVCSDALQFPKLAFLDWKNLVQTFQSNLSSFLRSCRSKIALRFQSLGLIRVFHSLANNGELKLLIQDVRWRKCKIAAECIFSNFLNHNLTFTDNYHWQNDHELGSYWKTKDHSLTKNYFLKTIILWQRRLWWWCLRQPFMGPPTGIGSFFTQFFRLHL